MNEANTQAEKRSFSVADFRPQAIILAIITIIFYANTFLHEGAYDDLMVIVNNDYVQQGMAGIPSIITKDSYASYQEHKGGGNQLTGGRYRPLSLITFAIEQQLMGVADDTETANAHDERIAEQMRPRHVINVLLYILSLIALLYFFRHIVFPTRPLMAFAAVVLFAILPVHTEVVANVKSRVELLSVLFISLTFIKAFSYYDGKKMRDLLLAMLCFFLALLSKEYAVTLVILLPLSFYIFRKAAAGKSLLATLPYLAPMFLYLFLRMSSVAAVEEGAEQNIMNYPYLYATPIQKLATEIWVLLYYLRLLLFPNVLIADYSYKQVPYTTFANPLVWLSLFIHVALIIAMCMLIKRRHVLGFAIAVYLANLALVTNFFVNVGAPMGERLLFHSSIGFCVAAAYLLCTAFMQIQPPSAARRTLAAFMSLLVVLSGYKTIARNRDWKNNETLFLTDVQKAPNSALINNNAAAACMSIAKKNINNIRVRNEWLQKAVVYFTKAIAINPHNKSGYLNRGLCYFNMGKADSAIQDWDSVRVHAPAEQNLGKYLTVAGKYFYGKGREYISKNMPDSAVSNYKKATDATPEIPETWYSLGTSYMAVGKRTEAKAAFQKALQLSPNTPEIQRAYNEATMAK